jgi:hypothetical protein
MRVKYIPNALKETYYTDLSIGKTGLKERRDMRHWHWVGCAMMAVSSMIL